MRIIATVHKNSGVSFHRLIAPLLLMPDQDVFITNNLLEEHFEKGCGLFVYNRILPDHAMVTVRKLQKQYGFKICVDIDDYWHLDQSHLLYDDYIETGFAAMQIKHMREADLITTTHERLSKAISMFNKNVHILPNAIPHTDQYAIERTPHEHTHLFWQGSDTHRHDIGILRSPINRLNKISRQIKMVMSGYVVDHPYWTAMVNDYTADLKHQYKLIPYAPVDSYYRAYAEADICLVPLVNSIFNRMKSCLKILEAANLGLPVIASGVHPYLGMPVRFARQPEDWVRHITDLVGSKDMQEDEGMRLREYAHLNFNFERINIERKQVFEHATKTEKV